MKTNHVLILLLLFIGSGIAASAQSEPRAVISADKMNILYAGIDNPVSIAVPGISGDKIQVTISNGSITGRNGKYTVKDLTGEETIIEVAIEEKPGEIRKAGSYFFKVAKIPDPEIIIGKNQSGNYFFTKEELINNGEINVSLNTPLDFKYEIISYTLVYEQEGNLITKKASGNRFPKDFIDVINGMKAGGRFWIEQVSVKEPDGVHVIPGVCINIIGKKEKIKEEQ